MNCLSRCDRYSWYRLMICQIISRYQEYLSHRERQFKFYLLGLPALDIQPWTGVAGNRTSGDRRSISLRWSSPAIRSATRMFGSQCIPPPKGFICQQALSLVPLLDNRSSSPTTFQQTRIGVGPSSSTNGCVPHWVQNLTLMNLCITRSCLDVLF